MQNSSKSPEKDQLLFKNSWKFILLTALSALLLASGFFTVFVVHPKIPVGAAVRAVAAAISWSTGSNVDIRGNYYLVPGKWTQIVCEGGEFESIDAAGSRIRLKIGHSDVRVHIPALLKKELSFDGIAVRNLTIDITKINQPGNATAGRVRDSEADSFSPGIRLRQTGRIDGSDIIVRIDAEDSAAPLEFQITSLAGFLEEKSSGSLKAKGRFASSTFEASVKTGPLKSLKTGEPFNFQTDLLHGNSGIELTGNLLHDSDGFHLVADFNAEGDHFADIGALLGYIPQKRVPYSLAGSLTMSPGEYTLTLDRILPGTEKAALFVKVDKKSQDQPSNSINLAGDLIDADALLSVFGPEHLQESASNAGETSNEPNWQAPVSGTIIDVNRLGLDADIKMLQFSGTRFEDIVFQSVMENGVIRDAPFSARFANTPVSGQCTLDARSDPPVFSARIEATSWDVGTTLKNAGIAEGIGLTFNTVGSSLKTSGSEIHELIGNLEFRVDARGGSLMVTDSNTGKSFPVAISHSQITGKPSKKIALELHGTARDIPIQVTAEVDTEKILSQRRNKAAPFHMKIDHKHSLLELDGIVPVPFSADGTTVNIKLAGNNMASFNTIFGIEIPVTGSYNVSGKFLAVPEGYTLRDMKASFGSSSFQGNLSLNTRSSPPELSLHLKAERIQLADLNKALLSQENEDDSARSLPDNEKQELRKLTDQTTLDSFNALISIEADSVFSGNDYLGNGSMRIIQNNGSVTISPFHLSLPGGNVDARFEIKPFGNKRMYDINIDISELDYGTVSRWFKPETKQGGTLSLHYSLESQAGAHEDMMANATGYIDFFVKPVNVTTGVIDLWAVNLISYLIPLFAPSKESRLHCIAGRFTIKDGKMKQDEILADTSSIQVKGTLEVDFAKKWIEARLRPIPKRPQFYSLATPVHVRGRLDDLKVGVARGGVIGTIIRLATSYIAVPVQWIIFEKIPRDGTDTCLQVFNGRTN